MESVSSKVFFLTSGFQILVAFDYSKINTEELKGASGLRGLIPPHFSSSKKREEGIELNLCAELYFREDWNNLCPETGFLREPTASTASLFGIFQIDLHILREENFLLLCPLWAWLVNTKSRFCVWPEHLSGGGVGPGDFLLLFVLLSVKVHHWGLGVESL